MTTFRLATFNAENLFARYKFNQGADPYSDDAGFTINDVAFDIYEETDKKITAKAIREVNADILCLQEVESLPVLDRFKTRYLASMKAEDRYDYRLVVDGNDPRNIDVAVMARKYPFAAIRTHRHERSEATPTQTLFSRDLLEVDFLIEGKPFTVFVNHFKSMMGGRAETRDRRLEQTKRMAEVIRERYGDGAKGNFAVVGDFNDYYDDPESSSLWPLFGPKSELKLVNIVENLPPEEQWTHFYAKGKKGEQKKQLDYILLPKNLGDLKPGIMRRGQPYRAGDYNQFPDVGEDNPKASDHCPLYVDIDVGQLE